MLFGQPKEDIGNNAEENQVSNTVQDKLLTPTHCHITNIIDRECEVTNL